MQNAELTSMLREAADATPLDDEVPLDAIHTRRHAMRRNRVFFVLAAAIVVVGAVAGGLTIIGRSGSSQIATGGGPSAAPASSGSEAPTAAHYYKATTTLSLREGRLLSPQSRLDLATRLGDDTDLLTGVADRLGETTDRVRHRIAVTVDSQRQAVDVTAIGTNPEMTVRLADTTADAVAVGVDERSRSDLIERQRELQARVDSLRGSTPSAATTADLVTAQKQLSRTDSALAALGDPDGTWIFAVSRRPRAVEIDSPGFQARWAENATRSSN